MSAYRVWMKDRASLRRWAPFVAVVLVVAAAVVAGASLADGPSGEAVLEDVRQKYETADNVVGEATVVVTNGTERASVEFAAAEGNRSRVTVRYGDGEEGRTVVFGTNGSVGWVYEPTTGVTRTYDNETKEEELETKVTELQEAYEENVSVERVGVETVGGEEAHILELRSEREGDGSWDGTARIWVSTEDSTVLKAQATDKEGTATVTFDETVFDASVHDSTFEPPSKSGELVPGADREEFDGFEDAQRETELGIPDLRDEYDFGGAVVASYRDDETVTAEYATEMGDVYVAVTTSDAFEGDSAEEGETEAVTFGDTTAKVADSPRGSVVYWTEGGKTTAVVTRGPRSTAIRVAESVAE